SGNSRSPATHRRCIQPQAGDMKLKLTKSAPLSLNENLTVYYFVSGPDRLAQHIQLLVHVLVGKGCCNFALFKSLPIIDDRYSIGFFDIVQDLIKGDLVVSFSFEINVMAQFDRVGDQCFGESTQAFFEYSSLVGGNDQTSLFVGNCSVTVLLFPEYRYRAGLHLDRGTYVIGKGPYHKTGTQYLGDHITGINDKRYRTFLDRKRRFPG